MNAAANGLKVLKQPAWESLDTSIVITDLELEKPGPRIVYCNDAFCAMTRYKQEELVGQTPRVLQGPNTDRTELQVLKTDLAEGRSASVSVINYRKDGQPYMCRIQASPLLSDDGNAVHFIAYQRELPSEVLSDEFTEELHQSHRLQAVGHLASGVAHEFNNLLQAIAGSADLILSKSASAREVTGYVAWIRNAVQRGRELTDSLLAFGQRQELKLETVEVTPTIYETLPLIKLSAGGDITVRVIPGTNIWPVMTDVSFLKAALLALTTNARDAMPDGGELTILITNHPLDANKAAAVRVTAGAYVGIEIRDTGVGMSSEIAASAFEPFYTTKDVGEGRGLGLSMVYGFVRQTGGYVEIESSQEDGTKVFLYFPRAHPPGES